MEPISGFRLPFPNFPLSQFLLFHRLPWPILRPLGFLWRLVGFRLEARGLDPSRHFAPFAVKNALVDRSIRSELKTYPLKLKPKLRAPVSQFLLFRRLPWTILHLLCFL